jgi:hypothetical protein
VLEDAATRRLALGSPAFDFGAAEKLCRRQKVRRESWDKGLAQNFQRQETSHHITATMAKSKTLTKKTEKATEAPLTTKAANGTPYQLDPSQVERAAKALVAHMKKHVEDKKEEAPKKSLAADEDEAEEVDEPIFLSLATKKQIGNTKSLKPVAMYVGASWRLRHTANSSQQATSSHHCKRCADMHLHQRPAKSLQRPRRL